MTGTYTIEYKEEFNTNATTERSDTVDYTIIIKTKNAVINKMLKDKVCNLFEEKKCLEKVN